MRTASALTIAALTAIALAFAGPARAGERWPAVPEEAVPQQTGHAGWIPWRCADGPVQNLYHGAWYDAPPAIYLGGCAAALWPPGDPVTQVSREA